MTVTGSSGVWIVAVADAVDPELHEVYESDNEHAARRQYAIERARMPRANRRVSLFDPSGRVVESIVATAPAAAAGASFDELLEHLDDLIALAANEGYIVVAEALENRARYMRTNRRDFDQRELAPSTAPTIALRRST